jgi:hypothetical protein
LADVVRTILLFSPFVVAEVSDAAPPYHAGLGDDIVALLFSLVVLSLFALLLGLMGGATVNADGPSATPPPATSS